MQGLPVSATYNTVTKKLTPVYEDVANLKIISVFKMLKKEYETDGR
jgi:hypothetical protein